MTVRYPLVLNGTTIQELQTGDTVAGIAASGANSDITSLTGLTTALSVAQGGTGATSAVAALAALGAQAALSNASATVSGILTSTDWTTFNSKQAALGTASASVSGILSSTDWTTFNNKQPTLVSATNIKTVNGTTLLGSGDLVITGGGASATKTIANKTAAYTVIAGDLGTIINCTSGTFTVSLTAAASLGSGFTCTIWNTGTGAITIDPNSTETIDGVATLILRQGEGLAIVCNGTNWETDDKKPMRGYAENLPTNYTRPSASGSGAIVIGAYSTSTGTDSTVLGYNCSSSVQNGNSIGTGSASTGAVTATGAGAMALGGSYASGTDSFAAAIGNNTSTYGATGANSVAIGLGSKATGTKGTAVGSATATGSYGCTAIGYQVTASASESVAIGYALSATGSWSLSLGQQCSSTGSGSQAIGQYAVSGGSNSLSIGNATSSAAPYSTAIGVNSANGGAQTATGFGAMALGGSYASGTDSFAAGIGNNTSSYGATGTNSVAIGPQARAYSSYSVAIGWGAQAGNRSVVIGGFASTAGDNSAAIGSYSSVINGPYSATLGGGSASDRGQHNRQAFGTIGALGVGNAQTGHFIFVANTTDATTTTLTSTGSTGSPAYIMSMTNQCAYSFIGTVVAKRQGTTNASAWKVEGMIVRGASEATTTLVVGTVTAISNANGWSLTLVADTTYGGLLIRGTGQAGVNIRWVAAINSAEVVYA